MFSQTYEEARERFGNAARAASVEQWSSQQHPLCGPRGEKLFLDVASWGSANAARTLVLGSGTHGIEGFVGSAIQTAFLEGRFGRRPEDVRVLLVHAVNPYGFAWLRRSNEDGVDLNRNFVDHTSPPSNREFTKELAEALVPQAWDGTEDVQLLHWVKTHGIDGLKRIIPRGQYEHWFAPFYGGRVPSWSNVAFRSIIRTHLKKSRSVVFIDYHSGLGERGTGQLIARCGAGSAEVYAGRHLWGKDYVASSEQATVAYEIFGDTLSALHAEVPQGALLTCAAHEFGTLPVLDVLKAVRFDHHLHVHGNPDPTRLADQKVLVREAFSPVDETWQEAVLDQAGRAISRALHENV